MNFLLIENKKFEINLSWGREIQKIKSKTQKTAWKLHKIKNFPGKTLEKKSIPIFTKHKQIPFQNLSKIQKKTQPGQAHLLCLHAMRRRETTVMAHRNSTSSRRHQRVHSTKVQMIGPVVGTKKSRVLHMFRNIGAFVKKNVLLRVKIPLGQKIGLKLQNKLVDQSPHPKADLMTRSNGKHAKQDDRSTSNF
jgi:hypothetical protein